MATSLEYPYYLDHTYVNARGKVYRQDISLEDPAT
jgi:hypothetical protein